MKRMKRFLSIMLALVLAFSMQAGNLTAFAEETPTEPLTETLPSPVLEDGHFDGEILKQWVDAYLEENYWNHPGCEMAIAYWYSGTDETWFYNADEWIGCVNWYKLPVCMHYAEKLKSGELTKESVVTGITLEYAMSTLLEHSSGPSLYSLVTDLSDREGLSYTDVAKQYAGDLPESYFTSEYYNNAYTARLMMEITKTLFKGGEDRFPFVLEHMKKSQPYDMFKRDWNIQSKWEVAQTHAADWGGEGDDLIHCTAIFYTPTPAILTIMTKNIWDLDIMGGVAGHFFNLTEELDLKQHPERAAQLAAAEAAGTSAVGAGTATDEKSTDPLTSSAVTEAGTPAESMPAAIPESESGAQTEPTVPGEAQQAGEASATVETPAQSVTGAEPVVEPQSVVLPPEETPPAAGTEAGPVENSAPSPIPLLIVLFILLLLIVLCVILLVIHKRKERERRRRRAAARRRRQREREMQRRYEEEEQEEYYDEEE